MLILTISDKPLILRSNQIL